MKVFIQVVFNTIEWAPTHAYDIDIFYFRRKIVQPTCHAFKSFDFSSYNNGLQYSDNFDCIDLFMVINTLLCMIHPNLFVTFDLIQQIYRYIYCCLCGCKIPRQDYFFLFLKVSNYFF